MRGPFDEPRFGDACSFVPLNEHPPGTQTKHFANFLRTSGRATSGELRPKSLHFKRRQPHATTSPGSLAYALCVAMRGGVAASSPAIALEPHDAYSSRIVAWEGASSVAARLGAHRLARTLLLPYILNRK